MHPWISGGTEVPKTMIEEHLDDCEAEERLRKVFFAVFAL